MTNPSRFTEKGQQLTKAMDSVVDSMKEKVPAPLGKVANRVPAPSEVVDSVTATANELLTLSQDLQNKVITALKFNA
jgi:hypothetical protein